jgi:hypothetical protein
MKLTDKEKAAFLIELFRQSDLSPVVADARRLYEEHTAALAAFRMARRLGLGVEGRAARVEAGRVAAAARARWRRSREKIIVMRFTK